MTAGRIAILVGALLAALAVFFVLGTEPETPPAAPAAPAKQPVRPTPPRHKRVRTNSDGPETVDTTDGEWNVLLKGDPEVRPAEPPPPEPTDIHRLAFGHVVDEDGKPVALVQVAYASIDARDDFTWKWTTTAADGKFSIDFGDAFKFRGQRLEVRAGAKGFRTWRGPPVEGDMTIRLERADLRAVPGRVMGLATGPDGRPLSGVIEVSAMDELFTVHRQLVFADMGGSFSMDGVAPGDWQLFLAWDDAWQDVTVPDGGEVRVELRTSVPAPVPTAWTTDTANERVRVRERISELEATIAQLQASGAPTAEVAADLKVARAAKAGFDAAYRASLGGREVVVTGLPATGVAILSAHGDDGEWRVQVRDGTARIPWIAAGGWRLVLERPGQRDMSTPAIIVAGDGPQTVPFPARLR